MSVTLKLPSESFIIDYARTDLTLSIPGGLDFDFLASISSFPILQSNEVNSKIIGVIFLNKVQGSALSFLQDIHLSISTNFQVLAASSQFEINTLYFIIPFANSNNLGIYRFPMYEIFGTIPNQYIGYIHEISRSQEPLRDMKKEYLIKREILDKESNPLVDQCEKLTNNCDDLFTQIREAKSKIIEASIEFNELQKKFEPFECMNCRSNYKDVLYLPCGHIVICSACLKFDHKIVVDLPIRETTLRCCKCQEKVDQALKYSI